MSKNHTSSPDPSSPSPSDAGSLSAGPQPQEERQEEEKIPELRDSESEGTLVAHTGLHLGPFKRLFLARALTHIYMSLSRRFDPETVTSQSGSRQSLQSLWGSWEAKFIGLHNLAAILDLYKCSPFTIDHVYGRSFPVVLTEVCVCVCVCVCVRVCLCTCQVTLLSCLVDSELSFLDFIKGG